MKLQVRDIPPRSVWALQQAGVHPLLAQLFAARGVQTAADLDEGLARLLPPSSLKGTGQAAILLAGTIMAGTMDLTTTIITSFSTPAVLIF